MYDLPYFKAAHYPQVLAFMKAHPFVTICGTASNGQVVATQVPVLFEERDGVLHLLAHVMRKTDHHLAFLKNPNVLVMFTGPSAYVSASWYAQPQVASTWNYQTVQARGLLRLEAEGSNSLLMKQLAALTLQFEQNADSPSLVNWLPDAYVQQHSQAIVAFDVEVTDLRHVFKLSQNRSAPDRAAIIARLAAKPHTAAMAKAMREFYDDNTAQAAEG
jgi:transcriptional regulator